MCMHDYVCMCACVCMCVYVCVKKNVKVVFYNLLYTASHISATLQYLTPGHRVCTFQTRSQLPGEHTAWTPIKRPRAIIHKSVATIAGTHLQLSGLGRSFWSENLPLRESNPQPSGLQPSTLTTRPLDPMTQLYSTGTFLTA